MFGNEKVIIDLKDYEELKAKAKESQVALSFVGMRGVIVENGITLPMPIVVISEVKEHGKIVLFFKTDSIMRGDFRIELSAE